MTVLDFNILKILTSNNTKAIQFANNYDRSLFSFDLQEKAGYVIDFIKAYRAIPTKKTFIARYADDPEQYNDLNGFWDDIEQHEYNENEYNFDLERLKKRFKKQTIAKINHNITKKLEEKADPEIVLKNIALELQRVSIANDGRSHIQKNIGDYVDEFKERYKSKQNNEIENVNIKTGYSMIDTVTGGISPAELILVAGESNAGKSILLNNMALQMWMQSNEIINSSDEFVRGYNVLYFSLEMPYEDCFNRFLARLADIPERAIREAALDGQQIKKMHDALEFIERYQKKGYYFNIVDVPRNVTIEEVELRFNEALLQFSPDIVVIDYLGLMHNQYMAKEQDWLKMGALSASLHEFARAYNVCVVTAAQLTDIKRNNKGNLDSEQRVGMHRIGRSSHIMHHVNVGIQIETRANEQSLPDMKYHIIKNRKGPLASGNLIKNFNHTALFDVPFADMTEAGIKHNIEDLIKVIRDSR